MGSRLREALQARQAAGVDRVPVQLAQAPARFLSGQETALVNHLSGGPAIPTFMPPRITERGLGGAPTLVQNAETLAHLALIARKGPRWFRGVGTDAEPGSMLATIRRADGRPRISEVPLGIPLQDLTGELSPDSAVLIGGYHGTWLTGSRGPQADPGQPLAGPGAGQGGCGHRDHAPARPLRPGGDGERRPLPRA